MVIEIRAGSMYNILLSTYIDSFDKKLLKMHIYMKYTSLKFTEIKSLDKFNKN